jgi:hypothetical protein
MGIEDEDHVKLAGDGDVPVEARLRSHQRQGRHR